ncbi:response regulator [Litoribacillus peritrichatus]|uniref:Response regulatory domain-containing protein n=1 Tax=Litoribacillus peritrichatus TaxID=718191 RepID=A0ABP7MQ01_9GAMM
MTLNKILSIDDTPPNQALINKVLSPHYDVLLAMSAQEGWDKIDEFQPDLILLDVNMPEQSGYEFCRNLRAKPELDHVGVIFVSALASIEERLEGYSSGGDDYVCKPFEPSELRAKVQASLDVRKKLVEAKAHADLAQSAAFTAMTSTCEIGQVLDFLVNSLQTTDFQEVAKLIFSMLEGLQLTGTVVFRSQHLGAQFYSPSGALTPIERTLMERGCGAERIVSYKHLYMFNSSLASILVKNMPKDENIAGRLRDHLAIAITIVEEKVRNLDLHISARKHKNSLLNSGIVQVEQSISKIDQRFSQFSDEMKERLEQMMTELQESMFILGLSEDQEASLVNKMREHNVRIAELYDQTDDFERELIEASSTLRKSLDEQ